MPEDSTKDDLQQTLELVEWAGRYFTLSPQERRHIQGAFLSVRKQAEEIRERKRQEEERQWDRFMDYVIYFSNDGPLFARPVRMAIYRTALILPVSLTISLYLLRPAQHHPMFAPTMIGMVAITSLIFQFASNLVRVNRPAGGGQQ